MYKWKCKNLKIIKNYKGHYDKAMFETLNFPSVNLKKKIDNTNPLKWKEVYTVAGINSRARSLITDDTPIIEKNNNPEKKKKRRAPR